MNIWLKILLTILFVGAPIFAQRGAIMAIDEAVGSTATEGGRAVPGGTRPTSCPSFAIGGLVPRNTERVPLSTSAGTRPCGGCALSLVSNDVPPASRMMIATSDTT